MKKMIVSSFYNTIIDEEDAIPTSTMLELDKYNGNGYDLTILSNRGLDDVLYYNQSYPFIDYVIAYNGSIIYDSLNDKTMYKKCFDKDILDLLCEKFSNYKMIFYTEKDIYYELPKLSVYKVEIIVPKKNNKIIDELEKMHLFSSYFKYDNDIYLEICPTNSFSSFELLMKENNILKKDVIAIIGNDSDKEFIKEIDNCYVVSNASKELKQMTKKRTKSNLSKGVEIVLKKLENKN